MGHRREYEIAFVGLKPGLHEFNYQVTDKFFDAFEETERDFQNCQANVKLFLDKKSSFMLLKFEVGGTVQVSCDRCNNDLPFQLWDEFNLTVKMVDGPDALNEQGEDPDVFYISRSESHLDVANWIYEFINLSIPMQKVCGYDRADGPYCNPAALEVLKKLEVKDKEKHDNPIWKGLEKFRNLDQ